MDSSTVRPKVAELTFQVLGRSLHPELFQFYKSHRIDRDSYQVQLNITADGHYIAFRCGKLTMSEVMASAHMSIPSDRTLLTKTLRSPSEGKTAIADRIEYSYRCEKERVPAEMLWMIQQKLRETMKQTELLHFFDSSGRIALGGMSFIHCDSRLNSLHVQAIHTFPDDLTLVKTDSSFKVLQPR